MVGSSQFTPAFFRWAFFMLACFVLSQGMAAPSSRSIRMPTKFMQLGEPDQEKGREILESFRRMGIQGDYYLQFELKVRPRRGEEIVFSGKLWGSRNHLGPVSRVELRGDGGKLRRYLLQNGTSPQVWSWQEGDAAPLAAVQSLFEPLVPETELTLFDLQQPYIYWPDFQFEGPGKILGRVAHIFLLHPPENFAVQHEAIGGVRVHLDTQYHALVKSTLIAPDGSDLKTMTLRDIKKISEQWMVKTIDLRNEVTRDKTRFEIVRVALNLDFSPQLFTADLLDAPVTPPDQTVSVE